jgi:hypothetical protein
LVEPIVEPHDKLTAEEMQAISPSERGRYIESSVLALINANENRGLTISEIERVTQYPKNTLLKHVDLLFAKRKINRISAGRTSIYFPNGHPYPGMDYRDIAYGKGGDHKIGVKLIENIDGKYVHIIEREVDSYGYLQDIGGVLVAVAAVPELINILRRMIEETPVVKENN